MVLELVVRRVSGRLSGSLYIHCQESTWKARRQACTPNIVRRERVSGRLQGRLVHTLSGEGLEGFLGMHMRRKLLGE
jgi:hypothetical protein